MAGHSNARLSVDLQNDVEEDHADLELSHQIPSDTADVHQFVGEKMYYTEPLLPTFLKIQSLLISFCFIFRPFWQ
jgi:hypothetical protein